MQIKLSYAINFRDISDKSPNRELEMEEDAVTVNEKALSALKDIEQKITRGQDDFWQKFGYRKGKIKSKITMWNPQVWRNKILPNMKYRIEIDGEAKEGDINQIRDFARKKVVKIRKIEIGIKGKIRTFYFGWGVNKHGKDYFGFIKKPIEEGA